MWEEKVLVVDDDKPLLQTISRLLEKEGYSVTSVDNGYEAIKKIEESYYDVVIVDVRMPDISGMEVLRRIRKIEENKETRSLVIIMTGYASEDVPVKAIKLGASDYILKPFDTAQFLYSVDRNMRASRLEREKKEYILKISKLNKELQDTLSQLRESQVQLFVSSEELKKAQEELENYNQTLEEKVEGRTKELKFAQAQLVQSAKMAAIGQLGAGLAHELNNPLGGILGYAQFMLEKIKRPDFNADDFKACSRYIESIERESTRCKKIVENLLKFSRKPFFAQPEPLCVSQAVEDTLSFLEHQLRLKNIKVIIDLKADLARIFGVVSELQQVFTNLILNAQQAMPEGGELRIAGENILDSNTNLPVKVKIEFTDTGCGIPQENLPRIFEPFFTTKEKEKGTGLGLVISYQIIRDHKGTIEVKSQAGKGTTFTIILPAAQSA